MVNTDNLWRGCEIIDLINCLFDKGYKKLAQKLMELEELTEDDINESCF